MAKLLRVLCGLLLAIAIQSKQLTAPPMGFNTWNFYACDIDENIIKETADAMASKVASLGYKYLNLDDCWQAPYRDKDGKLVADSTRFPSGIKSLADYVHNLGLKIGIYSSAGFYTCQKYPASLGYEAVDAATFYEWGIDYLKYDNCYTDAGWPEKRYSIMSESLRVAAPSNQSTLVYSLCEWGRHNPAVWASSIADVWRVSGDIRDSWESIISRVMINSPLWRYAGVATGFNDMDMLEVGNGHCTLAEYRSHFSLWSLLKSPLILGNNLIELDVQSDVYSVISNDEVIAVNQDKLGHQGRLVYSSSSGIAPSMHKVIATKCASEEGFYQDDPSDQQFVLDSNGYLRNNEFCLQEITDINSLLLVQHSPDTAEYFNTASNKVNMVVLDSCSANSTQWVLAGDGGNIVSQRSGYCLEVSKLDLQPLIQGKRVQTSTCAPLIDDKLVYDPSEHQSWVFPNGNLLSLYQRQCLTLDRDAFHGWQEYWAAPLSDNRFAVLLLNKGSDDVDMTLKLSYLSSMDVKSKYSLRDLWLKQDLAAVLSADEDATFQVKSHDVVMLVLTPTD